MRRVIIESPFAGDVDKNIKYARKCVRDSLNKGEAPIASHLLYTQPGILDDDVPEERQWGIDAGLAWRKDSEATIVYIDLGITRGMEYGIADAKENNRPIEYRSICNVIKYNHHGADVLVKRELKGKHAEFCLCYQCKKFHPGDANNCPIANAVYQNCVKYNVVTPMWECPEFDDELDRNVIDETKNNIIGYKGTKNGKCLDFQYEVGKTYEIEEGKLKLSEKGFHFCRKFNDVHYYYPLIEKDTVIYEIEALGETLKEIIKSVTDKIRIIREIPRSEWETLSNGRWKWNEKENQIKYEDSNHWETYNYDETGNAIRYENSKGYDKNGNKLRYEGSTESWHRYESSTGSWHDTHNKI